MKKILALALALIMAVSCCAIAFAAETACPYCNQKYDESVMTAHMDACSKNPTNVTPDSVKVTCPYCMKEVTKSVLEDHKKACSENPTNKTTAAAKDGTYTCPTCGKVYSNLYEYNACVGSHFNNVNYHYDKYINETIPDLLGNLIDLFQSTGIIEMIKNLVAKIWELIQNFASERQVAGAVSDLESKIGSLNLTGDLAETVKDIINSLKQKIKAFYAGDKATVAETVAEAPAETGSASIGIAAFAAVSVAAAAAYVCTKKRA